MTNTHQKRVWRAMETIRELNPGIKLEALEEVLSSTAPDALQDIEELVSFTAACHKEASKPWWKRLFF